MGSPPALDWILDVISAVPVTLTHDQSDLQRFARVSDAVISASPRLCGVRPGLTVKVLNSFHQTLIGL